MPTQNVGTLSDRTLWALVIRPKNERGLSAPKKAIGIDSSTAKVKETTASWKLGISRRPIAVLTSSFVM